MSSHRHLVAELLGSEHPRYQWAVPFGDDLASAYRSAPDLSSLLAVAAAMTYLTSGSIQERATGVIEQVARQLEVVGQTNTYAWFRSTFPIDEVVSAQRVPSSDEVDALLRLVHSTGVRR